MIYLGKRLNVDRFDKNDNLLIQLIGKKNPDYAIINRVKIITDVKILRASKTPFVRIQGITDSEYYTITNILKSK